ncbi:MAG: hypothetical protein JWR51_504 [Devosia sp.]|uniref:nuclear transport factor 2 family protein n=1 Tax=Devosia sp. TaxID=1871048 RepID=UPI0026084F36|nr:nuclear transport factor 2 family protein [Devosia sp.]MDB5527401.1 hypothetical protein [Devosia sp.]
MLNDIAQRLQQLEDRVAISERVIKYAVAIDRADWTMFRDCFTDTVHVDFSAAGLPASDFDRDTFVSFAKTGLSTYAARQHLSPNHIITFSDSDANRATCQSYMYAQHYQPGAAAGDVFLMHGAYTNEMVRTADGWKIERLTQHLSWMDGAPAQQD